MKLRSLCEAERFYFRFYISAFDGITKSDVTLIDVKFIRTGESKMKWDCISSNLCRKHISNLKLTCDLLNSF